MLLVGLRGSKLGYGTDNVMDSPQSLDYYALGGSAIV